MIDLIQQRMKKYNPQTAIEEENAIKEIMQEIALYALWHAGFFQKALFQGETSLRILYGLPRFSEDLDFILQDSDPDFNWNKYAGSLSETFEEYGVFNEILPKEEMNGSIKKTMLKDNSILNQLDLRISNRDCRKKIVIKLEVDINPPQYSQESYSDLDFPLDFEVRHQNLSSNFALKIHALLCRGYLAGRDWYDFNWYIARSEFPNMKLLQAALYQTGPWSGVENLNVTSEWLEKALIEKIDRINWDAARSDVVRFLKPIELESLALWKAEFFHKKVAKLMIYKNI